MSLTALMKGRRVQGDVVNLAVAAAANAVAIFQISNYAQLVGTKSVKLRRIWLRNNAGGGDWVHIGTGIPCVDAIPALWSVNNMDGQWNEWEVEGVEFFVDITAYALALPGGGSIDIQVEIEEIG